MMKNPTLSRIVLTLAALMPLLLFSCNENSTEENTAKTPSESSSSENPAQEGVKADLTVPPPGSQATQEKWDTFTEEKRQESWDKYLASLAEGDTTQAEEVTQKAPVSSKPVSVITAPLNTGPMEILYYGLGEVEAGTIMKVSPAAPGTARKVFVSVGDFVEPGDLLFSLDSSDWVRDLERSEEKWETELTLAQLRLDEAVKEVERTRTFYARDLVTRQDLEKADQALTEAQLNLDKIRLSRSTELEDLQENYAGRLGTSPGRGYVSRLSFAEGDTVNTADSVEIVNLEEVLLTVEVPENIISRIKRDAPVKAKPPTASRYGMEGVVVGHNVLPESNRTYQVRARLTNQNQRLLPGMLMEVQIVLTQLQPRFVVPQKAVISDGPDHYIFLVEENISKRIPVDLGSGRQGLIQVEGDLKEGDILVIEGQSYLKPGSPVTIAESTDYSLETAEL